MKRALAGIQPSGKIHLGNYFGSIKQHLQLQEEVDSNFYFIANFHSLTTMKDPEVQLQNTRDVALTYLSLGVDPKKALLYRQSDIPEIPEVALLLSMVTGMGELKRNHSFKDKTSKGIDSSVGLFYYPILMAADILSMQADLVPVGKDQKQHLEITRDIATHFNTSFQTVLTLPEAKYSQAPIVPGTTYNRETKLPQKMSKSYHNIIDIFAEGKILKKTIMGIETSTVPMSEEMPLENDIVYSLYSLFASQEEQLEMAEKYKSPNYGYGHAKKELLIKIDNYFAPYRENRRSFTDDQVEDILQIGAKKARIISRQTLERMREVMGIPNK